MNGQEFYEIPSDEAIFEEIMVLAEYWGTGSKRHARDLITKMLDPEFIEEVKDFFAWIHDNMVYCEYWRKGSHSYSIQSAFLAAYPKYKTCYESLRVVAELMDVDYKSAPVCGAIFKLRFNDRTLSFKKDSYIDEGKWRRLRKRSGVLS